MNKKSPPRVTRITFPLIIAVTVCLCVAVLVPGVRRLQERKRQIGVLREEKERATDTVLQLQREKSELETDEGIERAARNDLHLAKPGDTVFVFEKAPRTPARGGTR